MRGFLGFGRSKQESVGLSQAGAVARTSHSEYPTATQREMVRLTVHALQKRYSIPPAWMGVEIAALPTPAHPDGLLLQITVMHWHPGFGVYAPGIQHELLEAIKRFDTTANAAKYQVQWRFVVSEKDARQALPEPGYWTAPVQSATEIAKTPPVPQPKFELPDSDSDDDSDNGFAATQMHDMR